MTSKGNFKKPSRQQVLVARCFKGCGIANAIDGSEDGDLHGGLADVGAVVPEDRGGLEDECAELFLATDSEEPFDGFESDEQQ